MDQLKVFFRFHFHPYNKTIKFEVELRTLFSKRESIPLITSALFEATIRTGSLTVSRLMCQFEISNDQFIIIKSIFPINTFKMFSLVLSHIWWLDQLIVMKFSSLTISLRTCLRQELSGSLARRILLDDIVRTNSAITMTDLIVSIL